VNIVPTYHGGVPTVDPPGGGGVSRRRRLLALLAACHPEPALLVTVLTGLLVAGAGGGLGRALLVAAAVAAGQLAVGWSNDYIDRHLDRAAGRTDKPLAAPAETIRPNTVRTAAAIAAAAAVLLSIAVSPGFAAAHLVAVALALVYNARLKATPLSVVPYTVAFGLLPVAVTLALPQPRLPAAWAVLAAALVGAGGHFTQALPDIPDDRARGINGLPQLAGQRAAGLAAALLLLAANVTTALGPQRPGPLQLAHIATAAALAAGIVTATTADRPKLAFRLTLAAAATAVAALLLGGRSF
jgi:4-hydroxybenzoate polyprenyltransferase